MIIKKVTVNNNKTQIQALMNEDMLQNRGKSSRIGNGGGLYFKTIKFVIMQQKRYAIQNMPL